MRLTSLLLILLQSPHRTLSLQSKYLTYDQLVTFLKDGHVYLKDVLPHLRTESFRQAHNYARTEASKAYERYYIERIGCNETNMNYLSRVEEGDGAKAMRDCSEHVLETMDDDEDIRFIKPFYQLVDLHEHSDLILDIATGEHLASVAADLLQVDRVRLFQTRTFRKVPSEDSTMEKLFNHATNMHTDLFMVPIDTNDFFTLWCPLRNVTSEDSILTYARGSHRDISAHVWFGPGDDDDEEEDDEDDEYQADHCPREPKEPMFEFYYPGMAEPYTRIPPIEARRGPNAISSPEQYEEYFRIREEYGEINDSRGRFTIDTYQTIDVGDCVAHHGWTLHGATSQRSGNGPREAVAISYVNADESKLRSQEDRGGSAFLDGDFRDEIMFWKWYYDIDDGEIIDHPKLPIVWPQLSKEDAKSNSTEVCESCDGAERLAGVLE
mmetsp:Transcript_4168/g.5656  ORF Transcript_4168/g.5656 Transcript_4168/m.5656 type:complete len:438 (-) Transcript_4168:166-1479(-)